MQIMIEISDTLKDIADKEDFKTFTNFMWQTILMDAIKNGTPLPKGHGRLIDADDVCETHVYGWWDLHKVMKNAPTILEADGGDK